MHELIDERSREMHCLIAKRLEANPLLLEIAKENVERWLGTCSPGVRPVLIEWLKILGGSFAELLDLLRSGSERATRLRQSSPFAGEAFISRQERNALLIKFHEQATT